MGMRRGLDGMRARLGDRSETQANTGHRAVNHRSEQFLHAPPTINCPLVTHQSLRSRIGCSQSSLRRKHPCGGGRWRFSWEAAFSAPALGWRSASSCFRSCFRRRRPPSSSPIPIGAGASSPRACSSTPTRATRSTGARAASPCGRTASSSARISRSAPAPSIMSTWFPRRRSAASGDLSGQMFVDLGRLRAFKGSQRYAIPAGLDLSRFQSVIIWCEQFSVLISPADLRRKA